jgi:hypothetical protein
VTVITMEDHKNPFLVSRIPGNFPFSWQCELRSAFEPDLTEMFHHFTTLSLRINTEFGKTSHPLTTAAHISQNG